MDKIQQQRRTFLENALLNLCERINKNIINMNYIIKIPNIEEYIEIIFKDSEKGIKNIKIEISNKSLKEITIDTLLTI